MKTFIQNSSLLPALIVSLNLLLAARVTAQTFSNLYSFTGTNDGSEPYAGLVQGSDGDFYGTTAYGGTNNSGTIFKIRVTGALTTLYSFSGGNDGSEPIGALVQGSDGQFYGATGYGGPNNSGTLFKFSTNGVLTTFYPFNDDYWSIGGLAQGSDGSFYGTSVTDGSDGGTVFRFSTNGVLTTLHTFTGNDGGAPNGALIQGRDGNLYGTTYSGGVNVNYGTVFKLSTNGAFTSLYSFNFHEGFSPATGLVQGSDGDFYGTTESGGVGTNRSGTVFKISTNGVLTYLHSFNRDDGWQLVGALVQGSDGDFYGTTSLGGTNANDDGTIFKIGTNGTLTTLYGFSGGNDGSFPAAGLVQGSDGKFYGTTEYGGSSSNGTVFSLTLPSPPPLTITPFAVNVILSWPTNATGFPFTLQSTTNLISPSSWNAVSPASVVVSGQNTVTNPITGTRKFYRLSQ